MSVQGDFDFDKSLQDWIEKYKIEKEIENDYEESDQFIDYKKVGCKRKYFLVCPYGDLEKDFTEVMKKFDLYDEFNSAHRYAPIWTCEKGRTFESILLIFYDPKHEKAAHRVAYDEIFDEEMIKKLRPFCPCSICKTPWWNLTKYLACRGCHQCLYSDTCGDPSNIHLKEAAKSYWVG